MLIRGAVAAVFKKGEKTREEITDLMAGGASMARLEAEIESYMACHDGHPPKMQHGWKSCVRGRLSPAARTIGDGPEMSGPPSRIIALTGPKDEMKTHADMDPRLCD